MTYCIFSPTEHAGEYRCQVCQIAIRPKLYRIEDVRMECGSTNAVRPRPVPPSLLKRTANFTAAMIAHKMNGAPKCTQEQIDERLAVCQACEYYLPDSENPQAGICTHSACGCNLNNRETIFNKLAWSDQECPLGKWRRLDMVEGNGQAQSV